MPCIPQPTRYPDYQKGNLGEDTKGDKNPPPYLDPHYGAKTEQNSVQRDEEQKERQVMTYPSVTRAAKNDL